MEKKMTANKMGRKCHVNQLHKKLGGIPNNNNQKSFQNASYSVKFPTDFG